MPSRIFHSRTKEAERLIQTVLREWLKGARVPCSQSAAAPETIERARIAPSELAGRRPSRWSSANIVLDTNVLSALMRRETDPAVVAWLDLQAAESVSDYSDNRLRDPLSA